MSPWKQAHPSDCDNRLKPLHPPFRPPSACPVMVTGTHLPLPSSEGLCPGCSGQMDKRGRHHPSGPGSGCPCMWWTVRNPDLSPDSLGSDPGSSTSCGLQAAVASGGILVHSAGPLQELRGDDRHASWHLGNSLEASLSWRACRGSRRPGGSWAGWVDVGDHASVSPGAVRLSPAGRCHHAPAQASAVAPAWCGLREHL